MRQAMRIGLLFVFVLASGVTQAQQWPFELWHEGKVIMENGDTLRGLVKYDLQQDIVQYTYNDRSAVVLSARKVLHFEIFDNTIHQYRSFFTLPFSESGSYQALRFFELLSEGKLTLLSREALEYRSVPMGYYGGSYTRQVLVNSFYFMNERGDITAFSGKKQDLMNMMGRNSDAVEKYIRSNRLKFEEKQDLAKIISYYNSLQRI